MELKKYVLTIDNHIIDVSKGCIYANGHVSKFILKDNVVYSQYDESYDLQICYKIKKTSDNILDLVDVGDLIGIEVTPNAQITTSGYDGLEIRQLHLPITFHEKQALYNGGAVLKSEIKAIYKRQLNGDYKKYEVVK